MQNQVMVSIIVLTYNHEKYLKKALDSILMQQCNFQYEILVGDDCSKDCTPKILEEYQTKYPDKFSIKLRNENIGASKNIYELQQSAKGVYLAYLEGDDYWIDAKKLQRQIDFLEKNKEYVGCAHKCLIVDEGGKELKSKRYQYEDNFWIFDKKVFQWEDFCKWDLPGQIATIVHRNVFLNSKQTYDIIYKAHKMVADRALVLLLLQYGKFFCLDGQWSAYRIRSKKGLKNWTSLYKQINGLEDDLQLIRNLNIYSRSVYEKEINSKELRWKNILHGIVICIRKPSVKNIKLTWQLFLNEDRKFSCICFCGKKIIQKSILRLN